MSNFSITYQYVTSHDVLFLSYNMEDSNINDTHFEKLDSSKVADVVLVKKHYGNRSSRRRQRLWKLKHLTNEEPAFDTDTKFVIKILNLLLHLLFC